MISRSNLSHGVKRAKRMHGFSNSRSAGDSNLQHRFKMSSMAAESSHSQGSSIKISYVLSTLMVFGVGATAWGLYEFYATLTMWPKDVRGDLRSALKAKHNGDLKLSLKHLERAWDYVQEVPLSILEPQPLRKLTGVAILYAEALESMGQLSQAFNILSEAVKRLGLPPVAYSMPPEPETSSSTELHSIPPEHREYRRFSVARLLNSARLTPVDSLPDIGMAKRAVAMGLKLGALADELSRIDDEEYWLSFSVTESLRILRTEYELAHDARRGFVPSSAEGSNGKSQSPQASSQREAPPVRDILRPDGLDGELGLPSWATITKTELAAPMERLAAFYGRQGKIGNAVVLYRVASNLLTTADKKRGNPSVQEVCQALQIENAHMGIMMGLRRTYPDDKHVAQDLPRIILRAKRLQELAAATNNEGKTTIEDMSLCDSSFPAVLFNSGVYHEEEGQLEEAYKEYSAAYLLLRKRGPREEMYWAYDNARRVRKLLDDQKSSQPPVGHAEINILGTSNQSQ